MMTKIAQFALAALACAALCGCGAEDSSQRYLDRGMALFESGDLLKAKLEFRNALQIDAQDSKAWFMIGQIEEREGNWTQALGAFSQTIELDPQHAQARVKRGHLLLAGNQAEEALREAEAVLSLDPQDPEALILRSAVKNRMGDPAQAMADVLAALVVIPDHREGLVLLGQLKLAAGDQAGAIAATRDAIAANPGDIGLLRTLGWIYESVGQPEAATDVLKQIVEIEPNQVTHRQLLATYLSQHGREDEALDAYREAIAISPDNMDAKIAFIQYLSEKHSQDEARQELERMLATHPTASRLQFALADLRAKAGDLPGARQIYVDLIRQAAATPVGLEARWRLALLEMAQGNTDEAAMLAAAVLAEDANNEQALLIRGAIALGRDDADQVIVDARTVLRNKPNALDAMRLLAQGHYKRQELALAQDVLTDAIKIAPDEPMSYLELAQVRVAAGDVAGALVTLESLLEKVPENTDVQSAIARLQLGEQDWTALEASSARILEADPEHPLGAYLRGLLLQRQGDLDGAIQAFQQALASAPGTVEPLLGLAKAYSARGQLDQAESSARQLLAESPNNITASVLLAEILEASDRQDEAREVYAETLRFNPQASAGYLGLARLQANLGDNAAAIATLRKGIEATARNNFLLFNLGIHLEHADQNQEAAAIYEEALGNNPGADLVANNLAMVLVKDPAASAQQLDRALEIARRFESSDQAVFLDTLGWTQYRAGQLDLAADTLDRAMKAGEPFPELQYHLGMVYLKLGRTAQAEELLRSATAGRSFQGIDEARSALQAMEETQGDP